MEENTETTSSNSKNVENEVSNDTNPKDVNKEMVEYLNKNMFINS
jgi:hypothetical protein